MGARIVIEMDADFSHLPAHVPLLVARLDAPGPPVGLVLGSRGVAGGSDADRGLLRRLLTKAANLYIRIVLGLSVRDCNSGFRCWRRETLERIRVEETFSAGPAIVQELLFKTSRAGIGIAEVPIDFANRRHGTSTLTFGTVPGESGQNVGTGDGVVQNGGPSTRNKLRTAPLWGLGQRIFFLHDGRTDDLLQAIAAHDSPASNCFHPVSSHSSSPRCYGPSEANGVVRNFNALSASDKQAILDFLRSL
jgi:hypothetical protein